MNYRYERKFVFTNWEYEQLVSWILINPGLFKEIYHQRKINSVYFDTKSLQMYHDAENGVYLRKKVRIRWYGDFSKWPKKPSLEIKNKIGSVGNKYRSDLPDFVLKSKKDINRSKFKDYSMLVNSKAPLLLFNLEPTLLSTYQRRYFLSANQKYRLTIDSDLKYADFKKNIDNSKSINDRQTLILELKYCVSDDNSDYLKKIVNHLPVRLSKNSKYSTGIKMFNC